MFNFDSGSSTERPASLLDSAKGLFQALLATLDTRIAILSNEIEEEQYRVISIVVVAAAAFFCLIFGIVLLSLLIIVMTWETQWRLWVFGGVTSAYFIAAIKLWFLLQKKISERPKLFSVTRAELKKDIERLRS